MTTLVCDFHTVGGGVVADDIVTPIDSTHKTTRLRPRPAGASTMPTGGSKV